jgi:hypothetical protein
MSRTTGPDVYERTFMGSDHALARERVSMAWWGHAIFALGAVLIGRAMVAGPHFGHGIGLVALSLVWLLFMRLRTTVTPSYIHVQLGLFGPKIDVGEVERAAVVRRSALRLGGWGIRFGADGVVTYSVPAALRDYLQVTYRRGDRLRTVQIMSADPERFVRAIEQAREARLSAPAESPRDSETVTADGEDDTSAGATESRRR